MIVRTGAVALVAALTLCTDAVAHGPATAIGRAVEALGQVDVSYDPGAAVNEVEAGNLGVVAGDGVAIALLPGAAVSEIAGGPTAVAAEIAREAGVEGTLVALVGTRLAAAGDDISRNRLDELVRSAQVLPGTPATRVERLVRSVRAEPGRSDAGTPWGWVAGVVLLLLAAGAVVGRQRGRGQA